ncbi:MAG: hypothetical protein DME22_14685 [Verrucomicrobia bacterium]|nr:MAG: hypothetical protein DME22_14685 [Verrucomicrobiota bacterium]PYJ99966.1 MAG: hypothetical protein DME23_08480 [Verrucomicrobiota bacterium]
MVGMLDEKTILELQEKISAKYKADVAAIKRVIHLLRKNKLRADGTARLRRRKLIPNPIPAKTLDQSHIGAEEQIETSNGHLNQENLENDILSVVSRFEDTFTFADLMAAIKRYLNGREIDRKTVSWVIYRNKGKYIKIVRPGRGQRKAIYAKLDI